MASKEKPVSIFFANVDSVAGYSVTAIGSTPEEAMRLLKKAVRKFLRTYGATMAGDLVEYYGAHVQELAVGHAYLDEGRAGEVAL